MCSFPGIRNQLARLKPSWGLKRLEPAGHRAEYHTDPVNSLHHAGQNEQEIARILANVINQVVSPSQKAGCYLPVIYHWWLFTTQLTTLTAWGNP